MGERLSPDTPRSAEQGAEPGCIHAEYRHAQAQQQEGAGAMSRFSLSDSPRFEPHHRRATATFPNLWAPFSRTQLTFLCASRLHRFVPASAYPERKRPPGRGVGTIVSAE